MALEMFSLEFVKHAELVEKSGPFFPQFFATFLAEVSHINDLIFFDCRVVNVKQKGTPVKQMYYCGVPIN